MATKKQKEKDFKIYIFNTVLNDSQAGVNNYLKINLEMKYIFRIGMVGSLKALFFDGGWVEILFSDAGVRGRAVLT